MAACNISFKRVILGGLTVGNYTKTRSMYVKKGSLVVKCYMHINKFFSYTHMLIYPRIYPASVLIALHHDVQFLWCTDS